MLEERITEWGLCLIIIDNAKEGSKQIKLKKDWGFFELFYDESEVVN